MIVFVVWLIVFAIVFALALKSWDGALGRATERWMPALLRSGDSQDRWVVAGALAVLAATFIVKPISMLLTLLLLALLIWAGKRLMNWLMHKVKFH